MRTRSPRPVTAAIARPAEGQPPGPTIRIIAAGTGRPRRADTARPVQEANAFPAGTSGIWSAARAGGTFARNLLRRAVLAGPSGPDGIATAAGGRSGPGPGARARGLPPPPRPRAGTGQRP